MPPTSVKLTKRNLRFVTRIARKKYRGNVSEMLRKLIDKEEERQRKADSRKR
jgi:Arc/MetJ-type ribon-helix-helix transcriptional regulator